MCGIMAYLGKKEAYPIIMEGLKKLEYRGYDSAGVAIMNGTLSLHKIKGGVSSLEDFMAGKKTNGNLALGHTRWATHGIPSDINAHPHTSQNGRIVLVHNGIIENYEVLKNLLLKKGFVFQSETDSEVLVQYIEWYQSQYNLSLKEAVRRALGDVEGSYAIVVMDVAVPEKIVVAKNDNPLAVGIGNDGFYIASDAGPISAYTSQVIYLGDNEVAELNVNGDYDVFDLNDSKIAVEITHIKEVSNSYEKEGFDSYMLKEIFQQPTTVKNCLSGRIDLSENNVVLPAVDDNRDVFRNADRIIITACGTSWHAGLIAEYLIESLVGISVEVEYASEFRYRKPVIKESDIVVAISQSGETADTLAAIKLARKKGAFIYSIVNTPGSTIARHSDAVSYIKAGIEIGVASTKAFTGQVTLLTLLALKIGRLRKKLPYQESAKYLKALIELPLQIEKALKTNDAIREISRFLEEKEHALFLGRGLNFPVALEGALKLKEISYIHAEGYPAAEMKHGPIALIDENMPVFILATNDSSFRKLISNVQEIKSRKGQVIVIKNEDQDFPADLADFTINIPPVAEILCPIITTIPLQLFSYYAAKLKGCNIDKPRNLAKSVTVE